MRIAFTGPSSTGKTTLAQELAQVLDIPYLCVDTTTELRKFGYASHPELVAAGPDADLQFQQHLIERRIELQQQHAAYVTDRTPVDSLVYYYMSVYQRPGYRRPDLESMVAESARQYQPLIFVPYGDIPLVANGVRNTDDLYHRMSNTLYQYMLTQLDAPYETLSGLSGHTERLRRALWYAQRWAQRSPDQTDVTRRIIATAATDLHSRHAV